MTSQEIGLDVRLKLDKDGAAVAGHLGEDLIFDTERRRAEVILFDRSWKGQRHTPKVVHVSASN